MNVFCVAVFCAAAIAPLVAQQPPADRVIRLFNGKDLEGFDTFLKSKGLNSDPDKVFQVHDGMIDVSGTDYGYIITKKEYENYHLKAEFKWGDQTHPPRKDVARDSGILFHVDGPDQVWPKSNGKVINEGTGVRPARGRILFQSEGAELFFRNLDLRPLR